MTDVTPARCIHVPVSKVVERFVDETHFKNLSNFILFLSKFLSNFHEIVILFSYFFSTIVSVSQLFINDYFQLSVSGCLALFGRDFNFIRLALRIVPEKGLNVGAKTS